ncbi:sensor histidine kinase [Eleftheria terrae]|uniref:sensor histidine kinase n=1 Tax=Eleftheria terrae TaxID=1597781 RepID=UPI00263BADC6|nr:ATP-binding protein [Eleftheria terrae]WKB55760.1 ATP-binding protein [Eleftheria terrae]
MLAHLAGSVLSLALVALFVRGVLGQPLMSNSSVAMADLVASLRFDGQGQPVDMAHSEQFSWMYRQMGSEVTYRVLDDRGHTVLAPGLDRRALGSPATEGYFLTTLDGVAMRGRTVAVEHGGRQWFVQFAASQRLNDRLRNDVWLPLVGSGALIGGGVLLVVLSLFSSITVAKLLRPLRDASAQVARITPRELSARLDETRVPQEIRPLVHSFNHALERLERGFKLQQEFLASAAHELKTPLSLIRAQIDALPALKACAPLLRDVEGMARQVQQLLHLAEASEPQNYRFANVQPEALLHDVASYLGRLADASGVRLVLQTDPGLPPWQADRGALFTLVKNLVENAIQHAPRDSVVRVQVRAHELCVSDEGVGVAHADLPRIFDRFWRGPTRRGEGAGLGLSICQEIARAHGATLLAERGEPGLRMRLCLRPSPPGPGQSR